MIRNYLKTTFRNIWKSKGYSFLNIFSLAMGIASAGFILKFVGTKMAGCSNGGTMGYKLLYNWIKKQTRER